MDIMYHSGRLGLLVFDEAQVILEVSTIICYLSSILI